MLSRFQYELAIPMSGLFGVSFYNATEVPTQDGYKQEPLSGDSFPWSWFVSRHTGACVRAFKIGDPFCGGIRILAAGIGDGVQAYDIPASMMVAHDLSRIWAMTQENFYDDYYPALLLVREIPRHFHP
jgi:hypothetical protein